MKDDLRLAKNAVMQLNEKGEKEYYIDKCDLSDTQREILLRRYVKRQSVVQISMEMHLSRECVERQYRAAVLIMYDIIRRLR